MLTWFWVAVMEGQHFCDIASLDLEVHVGFDAEEMVLDVGSPE